LGEELIKKMKIFMKQSNIDAIKAIQKLILCILQIFFCLSFESLFHDLFEGDHFFEIVAFVDDIELAFNCVYLIFHDFFFVEQTFDLFFVFFIDTLDNVSEVLGLVDKFLVFG
jgi:hypothetical protein